MTTIEVDSQGTTGRNPAIAVDAAGDPHIVYHSWASWDLKYATLNPSSQNWQVSGVETLAVLVIQVPFSSMILELSILHIVMIPIMFSGMPEKFGVTVTMR